MGFFDWLEPKKAGRSFSRLTMKEKVHALDDLVKWFASTREGAALRSFLRDVKGSKFYETKSAAMRQFDRGRDEINAVFNSHKRDGHFRRAGIEI